MELEQPILVYEEDGRIIRRFAPRYVPRPVGYVLDRDGEWNGEQMEAE